MKNIILISFLSVFYLTSNSQPLLSDNVKKSKGKVIYLTTDEFKQKIFDYTKSKTWKYKGSIPAIVDFYTDWCRPCKMLSPLIESASEKYSGKVVVYKVNTDKEPTLAQLFNIQSIPSVLFIPVSEQPQMNVGLMSKEDLESKITTILKVK